MTYSAFNRNNCSRTFVHQRRNPNGHLFYFSYFDEEYFSTLRIANSLHAECQACFIIAVAKHPPVPLKVIRRKDIKYIVGILTVKTRVKHSTVNIQKEMVLTQIYILPVTIFILIPCSFIITYCIAVILGHVEVGFPYISDTGTHTPESCIFSLAVNIIAFLLAALMYVRYKQVEQHYRDHLSAEFTIVLGMNRAAVLLGWLGCFGVCILANFQETVVIIVHMSGALLAFGCAALYSWLQTIISHYVCPLLNSHFIVRVRVFLSLVLSAAFFTTLVAGIIAHTKFHGKDPMKWNPEDGGFIAHVVSTGAEWILVISFDFFILTFAKEMQSISISSPRINFIIEDLTLQNTDFYNSDDHLNVTTSQSSLRINSLSNSPHSEFAKDNTLTIQAVVH